MAKEAAALIPVDGGGVLPASVRLATPGAPVLVLAPGAGTDRRHPSLVALRAAVGAAGWTTVGFDFPYRAAGRRLPDRAPTLVAAWRAVVAWTRATLDPSRLVIGGRSMGGRMASLAVADGVAVDALVFLGFPLHPAGRPGVERAAHLPRIAVPMLFVQGARDALADAALLGRVLGGLPHATRHEIPEADHGFHVPKRSGRTDAEVQAEIERVVVAWLAARARCADQPRS